MTRAHALPGSRCATVMLSVAVALTAMAIPASAQSVDDGVILKQHELTVGTVYSHDSWENYWEGTLKRDNGNIGTLTTQTSAWFANYGVTDRLTVLGAVPYVWTEASEGVLHSMSGIQDATIAVKYRLFERSSRLGEVRAIAVGSTGTPLTDYTPDFQPLSIGLGSRRYSGRGTLNLRTPSGWYYTGSMAYTWRAGVTLDRPYYYTDDQFFLTDEVDMPNVFDYIAAVGISRPHFDVAAALTQQYTLGGGDIRRQDMPFVSNRMNVSRVAGRVSAPIPGLPRLEVQALYGYTIAGRNVGQSSTFTTGFAYRLAVGG